MEMMTAVNNVLKISRYSNFLDGRCGFPPYIFVAVMFCFVWLSASATVPAQALTGRDRAPADNMASPSVTNAASQAGKNTYWVPRCDADDSGVARNCEVFQRLLVRDTGQRVAEFAVGFPNGRGGAARGVVVLPLGIRLDKDLRLQIDDGAGFSFDIRYCTQDGCYAFFDLTRDIVGMMKRGDEARFYFTTLDNKPLSIELSLVGFTKAAEAIAAR